MGRRRSYGYRSPDERASIGDGHVESAISSINRTCFTEATVMVDYPHSREETLPMLFDDEDLYRMKQVRSLVDPSSRFGIYDVKPPHTVLGIDYDEALLPTMVPGALRMNAARVGPLLGCIAEMEAIYLKYERVKAVLRWLNRNATPGAVRYYFPAAMTLCPDTPIWQDLQTVPTRYSLPPGISLWLQSIKEAANTVAASLLLPKDVTPRPRKTMRLTLASRGVSDCDGHTFTTDQMTFNL